MIYNAALRLLQISIEGCISIANHIISQNNYPLPDTYSHSFEILEKQGVINSSAILQKMARFRNRIVHVYWDIDLDFVYSLITNDLTDIDKFLNEIEVFIDND